MGSDPYPRSSRSMTVRKIPGLVSKCLQAERPTRGAAQSFQGFQSNFCRHGIMLIGLKARWSKCLLQKHMLPAVPCGAAANKKWRSTLSAPKCSRSSSVIGTVCRIARALSSITT